MYREAALDQTASRPAEGEPAIVTQASEPLGHTEPLPLLMHTSRQRFALGGG